MYITTDGQLNPAVVRAMDYSAEYQERMLDISDAFETSVHSMSTVRFGTFVYPAKKALQCYFIRAKQEFVVEGLSPDFVGKGATIETAREDFCHSLHAGIQELIYKRPFEFPPNESERWQRINDAIDITVFKNHTPLVVQQYGTVSYGKLSEPCQIKWDNGYTEQVDLRQVLTPDFVTYCSGQPIMAVVRRDPVSRTIVDIPYVTPSRSLPSVKEMEASGFIDKVLNSDPFPVADWE